MRDPRFPLMSPPRARSSNRPPDRPAFLGRTTSTRENALLSGPAAPIAQRLYRERPLFLVTRKIEFCYGHRLLDYEGKCKFLHGHNGKARITIGAPQLDRRGMVVDFVEIKREIESWIDRELDHHMLLRRDDPVVPYLKQLGEPMFLMDANPTAENIAKLIHDYAASRGFPVIEVAMWETPKCGATYRGTGGFSPPAV